jgi:CubicO group peptidase (beta-lactamase class C family)
MMVATPCSVQRACLLFVAALALPGHPALAQSAANMRAASRYSAEREGDAVLVFRHDSLVFEDYQNGYQAAAPHPLASGTKTFTCVLAALGQADGLLALDEPVGRTLPEFRDGLKADVTIRELLNLTSGLEPDLSGSGSGAYADAVLLPMVARPGQRFAYGGASLRARTSSRTCGSGSSRHSASTSSIGCATPRGIHIWPVARS